MKLTVGRYIKWLVFGLIYSIDVNAGACQQSCWMKYEQTEGGGGGKPGHEGPFGVLFKFLGTP